MAKKNTVKEKSVVERALEYVKSPNTAFVLGVVVAALAVFFCFSFLSFFSSGGADQSAIDAATAVAEEVENSTGKSGAIVASYLVNDCFGWSSVLVVPLMVVIALRLMSLRRPPLIKWGIGVAFGIVWGSLFFGFIFDDLAFMTPRRCTRRECCSLARTADWCRGRFSAACRLFALLYDLSYSRDYCVAA